VDSEEFNKAVESFEQLYRSESSSDNVLKTKGLADVAQSKNNVSSFDTAESDSEFKAIVQRHSLEITNDQIIETKMTYFHTDPSEELEEYEKVVDASFKISPEYHDDDKTIPSNFQIRESQRIVDIDSKLDDDYKIDSENLKNIEESQRFAYMDSKIDSENHKNIDDSQRFNYMDSKIDSENQKNIGVSQQIVDIDSKLDDDRKIDSENLKNIDESQRFADMDSKIDDNCIIDTENLKNIDESHRFSDMDSTMDDNYKIDSENLKNIDESQRFADMNFNLDDNCKIDSENLKNADASQRFADMDSKMVDNCKIDTENLKNVDVQSHRMADLDSNLDDDCIIDPENLKNVDGPARQRKGHSRFKRHQSSKEDKSPGRGEEEIIQKPKELEHNVVLSSKLEETNVQMRRIEEAFNTLCEKTIGDNDDVNRDDVITETIAETTAAVKHDPLLTDKDIDESGEEHSTRITTTQVVEGHNDHINDVTDKDIEESTQVLEQHTNDSIDGVIGLMIPQSDNQTSADLSNSSQMD